MSSVVRAEALAARHCGGCSCKLLKTSPKFAQGVSFGLTAVVNAKGNIGRRGIARTVNVFNNYTHKDAPCATKTVPIFVAQDVLEPFIGHRA